MDDALSLLFADAVPSAEAVFEALRTMRKEAGQAVNLCGQMNEQAEQMKGLVAELVALVGGHEAGKAQHQAKSGGGARRAAVDTPSKHKVPKELSSPCKLDVKAEGMIPFDEADFNNS